MTRAALASALEQVLAVVTNDPSVKTSGAFRLAKPVSGPEALLAMRKLAELF